MLTAFLSSLFSFILLNIPIAFSLILTTIVLMVMSGELSSANIASSIYRGVDNFPLMAIPFFMLAGEIMNVGGMSKRIVNFANALVGHVTGGLGYVAVVASMIFAGVSGSAVADTSAIGSILLPIMKKEGYDVPKSTALISASGCIGPIIPPSIPMIIFGVIGGVSIVKLFLGGIIPGILIGVGLMIVWHFHAKKHGYRVGNRVTKAQFIAALKEASWALMLPVIILGGIVTGIYTPTEAAVVAVAYAFVIGLFVYRELRISEMPEIFFQAAKATAVVLLVCGAATAAGYMKSPNPSSPTSPPKTMSPAVWIPTSFNARTTERMTARPRALSAIPGAYSLPSFSRTLTSVPATNTVSKCAETKTFGPLPVPLKTPNTLPSASSVTSDSPSAVSFAL